MDEAKREARRKLLAEIESSWDSPKPGAVTATSVQPPTPEMQAALDAAADRLVESLEPPPISVPGMDELDSGWEEEDDDDEEDDDASEPELPDERLDPVAYAAAKKARDERVEARRERKRVKAEAKKLRRRARAEAAKVKQKGKTRKAKPPAVAQAAKVAKAKARAETAARSRRARPDPTDETDAATGDDENDAGTSASARAKTPPSRLMASKPMLSGTNTWMLAIALLVFIAAAIFAAVVAR